MSLRVVGIYLREVQRVIGPKRSSTIERGYVVLGYKGKIVGKLAISRRVFDGLRADGVPLLSLWRGRPIARKSSFE